MKKIYTLFLLIILGFSSASAQFFGGSGDGYALTAIGSSGGEVPLPIKLLYFTATLTNKAVNTLWSTASEANNDYFTIERAQDGKNFETLGIVKGAGNSNQTINYSFPDPDPLGGVSYYRLKQTDFNGKFTYANMVAVSDSDRPEVLLYPNLNNGNFSIIGAAQNSDLLIINLLGERIATQKISSFKTDIDISNSPNGVYYVYIRSRNEFVAKKMVVIH